jgi:hypothetical protein
MKKNSKTQKVNESAVTTPVTTFKFEGVDGKCKVCGKPTWAHEIGSTCQKHLGKVEKFYLPAPANVKENKSFIAIKLLCDRAEELGKSRGFAVNLTGGDAGTKEPKSPAFQVFKEGKRKFVPAESIAELEKMLKN